MTAPLTHYIGKTYRQEHFVNDGASIFRQNLDHDDEPLLRQGFRNTILLAPGGYNPPHYGHAELLTHALNHGGEDLNIIAAVMIPIDEVHLKRKFGVAESPLILPKTLRVSLCRNSPSIPNNVWVYDQSESEWFAFRCRLEAAIRSDGFTVNFMTVVGPDHVSINSVHNPSRWGCRGTIVSDACRRADFVAGHHNDLVRVSACADWRRLNDPDLGEIRRLIEDKSARLFKDALVVGSVAHGEREHRTHVEDTFCQAVLDVRAV
ncbi:hypothetical protein ACHAQH_008154 [Verticillium albo-atrum]